MTYQNIELETDSRGIATLWLNRPKKNNAFNSATISELILALDVVAADPAVRLLVLRGRGKHFCAGGDLGWMQEAATLDFNGNLADARNLAELLYNLYQLKKPTLAVVQGAAFGGAVGLVSCCDMAIGADSALFSLRKALIAVAAVGRSAASSLMGLLSVLRHSYNTSTIVDEARRRRTCPARRAA